MTFCALCAPSLFRTGSSWRLLCAGTFWVVGSVLELEVEWQFIILLLTIFAIHRYLLFPATTIRRIPQQQVSRGSIESKAYRISICAMRAIACTDLFRYLVLRLRRPLRVLRTTCERRTDRVIHLCVDSLRAPHLQMYRVVASYALQSVGEPPVL